MVDKKCYMVREITNKSCITFGYTKVMYDASVEDKQSIAHALTKRMGWVGRGFKISEHSFLKIAKFEFFDPVEVTSETVFGFSLVNLPVMGWKTPTIDIVGVESEETSTNKVQKATDRIWMEVIEYFDLTSINFTQEERDAIYEKLYQIVNYSVFNT